MIRACLVCMTMILSARAQTTVPELFKAAVEAQQRGELDRAVDAYRKLLSLEPRLVDARGNLGAALAKLGRLEEAIAEYNTALKQEPANKPVRMNLALAHYKRRDFTQAVEHFTVLHKTEPTSLQIATLLADSLMQLNKFDEAVAAVNPLEKTYSTNRDLLFVLGMSMIRAGQLSEGVQRIQKIAESSNAADMYLIVARTYLQLSDHERAGVAVQAAMRLKPDLPGLLTVRGMWMEKIGDHEGAAAILEKALVENTDDFQAHLHLGAIRYVQRDLPAARKHLTRALQLDSISPLARYEMALVERAEGNLQAAVAHLEEVVKGTPKWLQPHIELAALYYRVKRPADGARERAIVDKLSSEEHTQELESLGIKQ